ncbi:MAG: TMEM175 family protein [Ignavibacteria bacterium]
MEHQIKTIPENKELLSNHRIEALNDGVFAIVMTIIILGIDPPKLSPSDESHNLLFSKLFDLLPQLESYIISFLVLGLYWTRHQLQFKDIKYSDRKLLWINIFFLMFVGFIPFSTNLVMDYIDHKASVLIYCGNLMIIGFVLYYHWIYASKNYRLVDRGLDPKYIADVSKVLLIAPLIFIISMALSFISPRTSMYTAYTVPFIFLISRRVYKKWKEHPEKK